MEVISWILTGLIVGAVAKLIMPGKDPGGLAVTIILGIAGALVAAFTARALGFGQDDPWAGWIASVAGGVVLLALYRLITRQSASTAHKTKK